MFNSSVFGTRTFSTLTFLATTNLNSLSYTRISYELLWLKFAISMKSSSATSIGTFGVDPNANFFLTEIISPLSKLHFAVIKYVSLDLINEALSLC